MAVFNADGLQQLVDRQQVIFVIQIINMEFHGAFRKFAVNLFLWYILHTLEGCKHFNVLVGLVPTWIVEEESSKIW